MNFFDAKRLLDLPESWNGDQEVLKKNYKKLAMKYHPDKCKDPSASETFIKINEAYNLIEKGNAIPDPIFNMFNGNPFQQQFTTRIDIININDLIKMFGFNPMGGGAPAAPVQKKEAIAELKITPKEYFTGTVKVVKEVCRRCAGSGFETPANDISVCAVCKGDGNEAQEVTVPKRMNLNIPLNNKWVVKINNKRYSFINNKVYYDFDISLKESLVGFSKEFKDPFDQVHTVKIKQYVKQNDGFLISSIENEIVLLFNIVYPKDNFSKDILKVLKSIDF